MLAVAAAVLAHSTASLAAAGELTRFPGTQLRIEVPDGFVPADQVVGFLHPESSSSIFAQVFAAAVDEMATSLDRETLAAQGVTLVSKTRAPIGERDGWVFRVTQSAPGLGEFDKLMVFVGDETTTNMLVGVVLDPALAEPIESAMLAVRWDPDAEGDPLASLGFDLTDRGELEHASALGKSLSLALDEGKDEERTGRPILVAGPAIQSIDATDFEAFARRRALQQSSFTNARVRSTTPIEIDGLFGHEVLADAISDSDVPSTLYLAVLFEGSTYWIVQGCVATADAGRYVPMFRRIAASLERDWTTFTGGDGPAIALDAPTGWSQQEGTESAPLLVANRVADTYVMAGTQSKAEIVAEGVRAELADILAYLVEENAGELAAVGEPTALRVGERDALQLRLRSSDQDPPTGFLMTVVDDGDRVHQILAWTLDAGFDQRRRGLDAVIATFDVR